MTRSRNRGFTLVELMAVVTIVGILATIGVMLMHKHLFASKSVEAFAMIQSIRAAEERWRAETQDYLDVSPKIDSWYPMAKPGKKKWGWGGEGEGARNWRLLNPTIAGPVQFGYAVKAGPAGQLPPDLSEMLKDPPSWDTAPTEPWYLIVAKADVDEDNDAAYFAASSFSGNVYSENEGE